MSALASRGIVVRAFARRRSANLTLPTDVESIQGDILNVADIEAAIRGVDAIVHLAARLHVPVTATTDQAAAHAINVIGTKNIVAAARVSGARIVFASSIAVYGSTMAEPVTEDQEPNPATPYAVAKVDGERAVLAARDRHGAPLGVVLRLGAVYGPRVKGNYAALIRTLEAGCFVRIGTGMNVRSIIYEWDVPRAVLLALKHPLAPGRIFNVTDGKLHTVDEIISAICLALGTRTPRFQIPPSACRLAARMTDRTSVWLRGRPVGLTAAVEKYLENVAVSSARIRSEMGFAAHCGLEEGWRAAVRGRRAADI